MRIQIKNQQDFAAGLMFVAFGVIGLVEASGYDTGTALNMGPGYFPTFLSAILALIGGVITLRALQVEGERVTAFKLRGIGLLSLAFIGFGLFMDTFSLGFGAATAVAVALGAVAKNDFLWREVIVATLVLVACAIGIFIFGLNQPYPIFWWN